MSVFDRLSSVLKGAVSLKLTELETRNPEAVYAAAIEAGTERLGELKEQLAGLIARRNGLEEQTAEAERELQQARAAVSVAQSEGEEDTLVVLMFQCGELQRKLETAMTEVLSLEAKIEEGKSSLVAFRGDLEALKRERETMIAQKELAAARIVAHDTEAGLSGDADVVALGKVREAVEALEARAHDGMRDQEGNPIHAKVEDIVQKSAEERAREELERLKSQLRDEDDED